MIQGEDEREDAVVGVENILGCHRKPAKETKSQAFIAGRGFLSIKYFHTSLVSPNRGFLGYPVLLRPQST